MEYLYLSFIRISLTVFTFIAQPEASGGGSGDWESPMFIFGWPFKKELDLGHLLTFLTLFAGFTAWLIATVKDRRKARRDEERSGALRLLLRILRESPGAIPLPALRAKFESAPFKKLRVAYCNTDFRFKDAGQFESAVYRLDFEGKIDFPSPDEIAFRIDKRFVSEPRPTITALPDTVRVLAVFSQALLDDKTELWELQPLTEAALQYDAEDATARLNQALASDDVKVRRKAAAMMGKFPAPAAARARAGA